MDTAREAAWKTRRLRYGPRGNRGTYRRCVTSADAILQRRRLARLVAVVHAHGMLSEGQIARVLGVGRVEVREIEDIGRDDLHAQPLDGAWGSQAMKQIQ